IITFIEENTFLQEGHKIVADKPYFKDLINKVIGSPRAYNFIKDKTSDVVISLRKDQMQVLKMIEIIISTNIDDKKIKKYIKQL
ncbi:hypothetical protein, partial [Megamonas funiformis]